MGAKLKGELQHPSAEHLGPKVPHHTATASPKLTTATDWWVAAPLEQK